MAKAFWAVVRWLWRLVSVSQTGEGILGWLGWKTVVSGAVASFVAAALAWVSGQPLPALFIYAIAAFGVGCGAYILYAAARDPSVRSAGGSASSNQAAELSIEFSETEHLAWREEGLMLTVSCRVKNNSVYLASNVSLRISSIHNLTLTPSAQREDLWGLPLTIKHDRDLPPRQTVSIPSGDHVTYEVLNVIAMPTPGRRRLDLLIAVRRQIFNALNQSQGWGVVHDPNLEPGRTRIVCKAQGDATTAEPFVLVADATGDRPFAMREA